jgi:hypothetical protein
MSRGSYIGGHTVYAVSDLRRQKQSSLARKATTPASPQDARAAWLREQGFGNPKMSRSKRNRLLLEAKRRFGK